jgi:hypothetical protein
MIKSKRKLFVRWSRFKLSYCFVARSTRESKRILTQARHYNRMVAERGHGVYRSVVLNGRRY